MSYIEVGKSEHARLVTGGERLTEGDLAAGNFVSRRCSPTSIRSDGWPARRSSARS